jgi:putative ABC transport system ATP-binding protein
MNAEIHEQKPGHSSLEPEARLVWTENNQSHEKLIDRPEVTIGRGDDNDVVLNDPSTSRNHCVIVTNEEGRFVLDLESANGTFVNEGLVFERRTLNPGDRIRVGGTEFLYELLPQEVEYEPSQPAPIEREEAPVQLEPEPSPAEAAPEPPEPIRASPGTQEPPPEPVLPEVTTARLVWKDGEGTKVMGIGQQGITLGRSSKNDLQVQDMAASRVHCKISPGKQGFMIEDLDSTNGTFVNYHRVIGSRLLHSGDKLQIGESDYFFESILTEAETIVPPGLRELELDEQLAREGKKPKVIEVIPARVVTEEEIEQLEAVELPMIEEARRAEVKSPVIIDVQNVIKDFESPGGTVRVLKGINVQIHAGRFIGIRGPSGSGKSTLINMITGIDRPTSGEVIVAGQSLNKLSENKMSRWRGEHIGVIFQFFQLLPTLTIIENIMLPMDFCRKGKAHERQERAMALLELVGLTDQAYKLPSTLSGGQQQRAAIARALANDPPLIVADEPTGNLDSKTADRVFALFNELVSQGTTFLMVTHDVELANRIPRVIEVRDGELYEQ